MFFIIRAVVPSGPMSRAAAGVARIPVAVLATFLTLACGSEPTSTNIDENSSPVLAMEMGHAPVARQDRPHERLAREIAAKIPEFAGLFERSGRVEVMITHGRADRAVRAEVQDRLRARRPANAAEAPELEITVTFADYSFLQLEDWRDRVSDGPWMNHEAGIVTVDLNEQRNRVVVGVLPEVPLQVAEAAVLALGVPREAVVLEIGSYTQVDVERRPSVRTVAFAQPSAVPAVANHLNRRWDTVQAAVQYMYDDGTQAVYCTMGPLIPGGFLTNSHCTNKNFDFDGMDSWQGNNGMNPLNPADKYGFEVIDPQHVCGTNCRWSDAAAHSWNGTRVHGLGLIAKPQNMSGSLWRDMSVLGIEVWGKLQAPLQNETVHKIGRRGGWSSGTVTLTCVDRDQLVNGVLINVKCQDEATYSRSLGDSGGPVFKMIGGHAYILGIHSGSNDDTGAAIFSAVGNIELDLGMTLFVGPWPWMQ